MAIYNTSDALNNIAKYYYPVVKNVKTTDTGHLPYDKSEDLTLSLTNLNDVTTSYIVNKNFNRLLTNDLYLAQYNRINEKFKSTINPFLAGTQYKTGDKIYYNVLAPYTNNRYNKIQILTAIKETTQEPTENNIIKNDIYLSILAKENSEYELNRYVQRGYCWAQQILTIDKDSDTYKKILQRRPLAQTEIDQLANYIKADYINYDNTTSQTDDNLDYVVSAGYTKGPAVIQAKTTSWSTENLLYSEDSIVNEMYSWYRIYKSGLVEQGGITKPFTLPEQWNGSNEKCLITIRLPIPADCLNVTYNFVLSEDNWMTKYDNNYTIDSLLMYHILDGRKTEKNYVYPNMATNKDANVGHKISQLTPNEFSIWLSYETFDLDAGTIGQTDGTVHKISWKFIGIKK